MNRLLETVPLWSIALLLALFFAAIMLAARVIAIRRCSDDVSREKLSDESIRLLTGLAATFAFFVGFAITVTWGAVAVGQAAVEQQSSAVRNMNWGINNIPDEAEGAQLKEKLIVYVRAAAYDDANYLAKGKTGRLPSAIPFDRFQDALHTYAFAPNTPKAEVTSLVAAAGTLGSSSSAVSAVAQRTLPSVLAVLLLASGILVSVVMGISTVNSRHPSLILVWSLVPALSITVVVALASPFATSTGVSLGPMEMVYWQLIAS
ncbi:MAG: hypothetical protein WEB05_07545 [Solirubrobacterales bacterium]